MPVFCRIFNLLRMARIAIFILWFSTFCPETLVAQKDTFLLFYLGGQSNMDGFGYVNDLPEPYQQSMDGCWIFTGNPAPDGDAQGGMGQWEVLRPGHGVGFSSDGQLNRHSNRFGAELSFASAIKKQFPSKKIALIKYSRGGTSIDSLAAAGFGCWDPDFRGKRGINQYDHFLTTLRHANATSDINRDGIVDVLIPGGILWMQGESDATISEQVAKHYSAGLKRMIDLFRAALHSDDLPVVIGRISDSRRNAAQKVWTYGELIQYAQEQFVKSDQRAAIVRDTESYNYSDPWHYDSEGYLKLGEAFAREMVRLLNAK